MEEYHLRKFEVAELFVPPEAFDLSKSKKVFKPSCEDSQYKKITELRNEIEKFWFGSTKKRDPPSLSSSSPDKIKTTHEPKTPQTIKEMFVGK